MAGVFSFALVAAACGSDDATTTSDTAGESATTEAMEEEPFDSVISETTRIV